RLVAERERSLLVGQRLGFVLDEVPELRLVVVSDRLLERDRRLRRPADLVDLLDGHLELDSDLRGRRLTPELGTQLPLRPEDLVQLLDDVDRHPDRPALVGERPRDRLPDPPRGVRRELEPFPVVELLGGPHEPDRALLDQVEKRQSLVAERFAIETTRRRFASTIACFAPWSPRSIRFASST